MSNYYKLAINCIKQNKELSNKGLVLHNFGNVSIRIDENHFVIKPSGAVLSKLKSKDMPIIKISSEKKIYGNLKPSTDMPTHLEIYKKFKKINSIAHCHSIYATAWAQSSKPIPLLGTTHADYWKGEVPVAKHISKKNLIDNYEKNTGKLILKTLKEKNLDVYNCPGIIVAGHGAFTWGIDKNESVLNAEILEFIAKAAYLSLKIKINKRLPEYISNKHYQRKHGKKAYYGQN